jgi:hypothetical protein
METMKPRPKSESDFNPNTGVFEPFFDNKLLNEVLGIADFQFALIELNPFLSKEEKTRRKLGLVAARSSNNPSLN